jgi:hypothetical protein
MSWLILTFCPMSTAADTISEAYTRDTILHVVEPGDNLTRIAERYRQQTCHYAFGDLLTDIRRVNDLDSDLLRPGRRLLIPVGREDSPPVVSNPVAAGAPLHGIYLTGPMCGTNALLTLVDRFIAVGGNGIVFDAKDIDGGVCYSSQHSLASWGLGRRAPVIPSLDDLIRRLHARRLHVVARVACFLDGELGRRQPELALADTCGNLWGERGQIWVDPANPRVRAYAIALAVELAAAQVDEVQFDYVRFPTNGWQGDDKRDVRATAAHRRQVITSFLQEARSALADYPVQLSADLYGIMAYGRAADQAATGQHIADIAACVDVICPMVYPSHFGTGFAGYDRPADHPAHFVAEGCRRFARQASGGARIRPWLQAFSYKAGDYNENYVLAQIIGARNARTSGWCLWNPASRYDVALSALQTAFPAPTPLHMVMSLQAVSPAVTTISATR